MIELFEHIQELVKEAAEQDKSPGIIQRLRRRRKRYYLEGKRIGAKEHRNIVQAAKKVKPKSETERKVREITGAKPTHGQLMRWGILGAGAGLGTHVVGSAIEGGKPWIPRGGLKAALKPQNTVLAPRNLLRAGAVGAAFASGVPVARKLWDIQTARERPEAF